MQLINTLITNHSPGPFHGAWMEEGNLLNPARPTIMNSLMDYYLAPNGNNGAPSPASTPAAAAAGAGPLSPITLVAPLPSITPPNPATNATGGQQVVSSQQVSGVGGLLCQISNWAENNKGLAVLAAFGIYLLVKGGNK